YQHQIEETVKLIANRGAWSSPRTLCYQSKVGPAEWLKPSLHTTLRALAARGRKHLLVIPISFVTEHIETLHEINIEAREEAVRLGIRQFEMMPALNDDPIFIHCLADLVLKTAMNVPLDLPTCRMAFDGVAGGTNPTFCPYWEDGRR